MIKLKRNRKKFISMIPFNTLAFHLVLFHIQLILRIEVYVHVLRTSMNCENKGIILYSSRLGVRINNLLQGNIEYRKIN